MSTSKVATRPNNLGRRSLEDRIAEAMRRERLGLMRPLWADWPEDAKADWLGRAAQLQRLFIELGVDVRVRDH